MHAGESMSSYLLSYISDNNYNTVINFQPKHRQFPILSLIIQSQPHHSIYPIIITLIYSIIITHTLVGNLEQEGVVWGPSITDLFTLPLTEGTQWGEVLCFNNLLSYIWIASELISTTKKRDYGFCRSKTWQRKKLDIHHPSFGGKSDFFLKKNLIRSLSLFLLALGRVSQKND